MKERPIINDIMLRATERGGRLFRNSSGKYKVEVAGGKDRWIQFGVASPGGSDLIGWMPVGAYAVFTAIEVKAGRTRTTEAQKNFVTSVIAGGGIAGIIRSVEEFDALIDGV